MARVFNIPRYANQTSYKLFLFDSIDRDYARGLDRTNWKSRVGTINDKAPLVDRDGIVEAVFWDSVAGDIDEDYGYHLTEDEIDDIDFLRRYASITGAQRSKEPDYTRILNMANAVLGTLEMAKKSSGNPKVRVWADDQAANRLLQGYYSGRYKATASGDKVKRDMSTCKVSRGIATAGAVASNHGMNVINLINTAVKLPDSYSGLQESLYYATEALEKLRLRGSTPANARAHKNINTGEDEVKISDFCISSTKTKSCTYAGANLGSLSLWKVVGLYFLVYHDGVYILDLSGLVQVHACMKSASGAQAFTTNYRNLGGDAETRKNYRESLDICWKWLTTIMCTDPVVGKVAKHMKTSLAVYQNSLGSHQETMDTGVRGRDAMLREAADADADIGNSLPYYTVLESLPCPDRHVADFTYLFHLLPAPDIDPIHLFNKARVSMQQTNPCNKHLNAEFLRYCKAIDFCKVASDTRALPGHQRADGYSFEDTKWFTACLKGKFRLPPKDEWGKVWLYKHFDCPADIYTWYETAGDVTRVEASLDVYDSVMTKTDQPRVASNELLYALANAPKLSGKLMPDDVVTALGKPNDKRHRVADMAGKSENTKPGAKVRETWSADDCTRELTSWADRSTIPLSQHWGGAVARKSRRAMERRFNDITLGTIPNRDSSTYIVSMDAAGWSPNADRDLWCEHHDYVAHTSKIPDTLTFKNIWGDIHAAISRRGVLGTCKLDKGMFQGWTGGCDTLLNYHMCLWSVNRAKEAGLLQPNEATNSASLIDDSVQALKISKSAGNARAQEVARGYFKFIEESWAVNSAVVEKSKTYESFHMYVFLNRLFCHGSEVTTAMKVWMKADRSLDQRFASIHQQIDTVFGSFGAAVERGACPITSYVYAIQRSLDLIVQSASGEINMSSIGSHIRILNAAFAPRTLGGWGFPTLAAWLTQESQDKVMQYCCSVLMNIEAIKVASPDAAMELMGLLTSTMDQQLEHTEAHMFMQDPWAVRAEGVPNPTGLMRHMVIDKLKKFAKSPIFREALALYTDTRTAMQLDAIIKSASWDAAVLECMSECMPSAVVDHLVTRALENELLAAMCPFRVRTEVSKKLKLANRAAVKHLIAIKSSMASLIDVQTATRHSAYEMAQDLRERYHALCNVKIVNCTLPYYAGALCRSGTGGTITVKVNNPVSSCTDANGRANYANFYDGRASSGLPITATARTYMTLESDRQRILTKTGQCIDKAAVLSAYVSKKGGDGNALFNIVTSAFGVSGIGAVASAVINPSVSTKRISSSKAHAGHPIRLFNNTLMCAEATGFGLGNLLSSDHYHSDYLSFVTAAKCIGLVERAAADFSELHYHLTFGSLPATSPTTFEVLDAVVLAASTTLLNERCPETVRIAAQACGGIITTDRGDDADIVAVRVGFGAPEEGMAAVGQTFDLGNYANLLTSGVPVIISSKTKARQVGMDEAIVCRAPRNETIYRKVRSRMRQGDAACVMLITIVGSVFAGHIPNQIYHCNLRDAASKLDFIDAAGKVVWQDLWKQCINGVRNLGCRATTEDIAKVTGSHYTAQKVSHSMHTGEIGASDDDKKACAMFVKASLGHYACPATYTITASAGSAHIRKAWSMASKRFRRQGCSGRLEEDNTYGFLSGVYMACAEAAISDGPRAEIIEALNRAVWQFCTSSAPEHYQDPAAIEDWHPYRVNLGWCGIDSSPQEVASMVTREVTAWDIEVDRDVMATKLTDILTDISHIGLAPVDVCFDDPTVAVDMRTVAVPVTMPDFGVSSVVDLPVIEARDTINTVLGVLDTETARKMAYAYQMGEQSATEIIADYTNHVPFIGPMDTVLENEDIVAVIAEIVEDQGADVEMELNIGGADFRG